MPYEGPWRVNAPHVIAESVDGEVLIVHLLTGAYYSSEGVGDAAWGMLARGKTLPELVGVIAGQYGLPESKVLADLEPWLTQLLADELLIEGAGDIPSDLADTPLPAGYAAPQMSKYTDMEDLLLLDPVHEVDEVGWPVAGTPT